MQITLAEALPLLNVISNRINDLVSDREDSSYIIVEKGEKYERPRYDLFKLTEEIEQAWKDYVTLSKEIARANLENTIEWDGKQITIAEAIDLAKQIRAEIVHLRRLANRRKQEYVGGNREKLLVKVLLYEPEEAKKLALKLERKVNRLSSLIEAKNHSVMIEFPNAEKYLDL